MQLSGSLIHVDEGGLFDINLKGKPGSANGRGLAVTGAPVMYIDLPVDNVCADYSPGPSGVLIPVAEMTLTFKDGSMIWGEAAPDCLGMKNPTKEARFFS